MRIESVWHFLICLQLQHSIMTCEGDLIVKVNAATPVHCRLPLHGRTQSYSLQTRVM